MQRVLGMRLDRIDDLPRQGTALAVAAEFLEPDLGPRLELGRKDQTGGAAGTGEAREGLPELGEPVGIDFRIVVGERDEIAGSPTNTGVSSSGETGNRLGNDPDPDFPRA